MKITCDAQVDVLRILATTSCLMMQAPLIPDVPRL